MANAHWPLAPMANGHWPFCCIKRYTCYTHGVKAFQSYTAKTAENSAIQRYTVYSYTSLYTIQPLHHPSGSAVNRCFRRRGIQNISLTRPPANHLRRRAKCVHQGHVAISATSATHTATQTAQHANPAHPARFGTLPSGGAPVDEDASSYGASQSEVAVGAE